MSLTKSTIVDQITVTENGIILVRETTRVMDGDTEIAKSYHRNSFAPGADLTGQPDNVVAIAAAAWTPEVLAAYEASHV